MKIDVLIILIISIMFLCILSFFVCYCTDQYVNERCRENGYDYGVFHITTGKLLCSHDGKYATFKDAVK